MSKTKFCPECGTKILETQKFCAECGYNFEEYNKTVGVFPDSEKKRGEGTIGVFETRKEKTEKEKKNVNKEKNPGTPIYKKWYVWAAAAVVIVIGLVTAFGGWGVVSDMAMYDENDTSDRIVLDGEIPDPNTLSYYDYVMTNCPEKNTEVWETVDSIKGHEPKFQKNENEIAEPYVQFEINIANGSQLTSKEDFNNIVRILKNRLDVLEAPYAIKYQREYDGEPTIVVKTGLNRIGQPMLTMLTNVQDEYNSYPKLVSQMDDWRILNVSDFSFKKKLDGEYDMFIAVDKDEWTEEDVDFMKAHEGENIYWTYGEGVTMAAIPITSKIEEEEKIKFTEISFLNNRKPSFEESFLLKLLYVSLKGEQYPCRVSIGSHEFSENADVSSMGYHIWTAVDEIVKNSATSLHSNVKVYREFFSPVSEINVEFVYDEGTFSTESFVSTVKQLYQNNPEISGGGYGYVNVVGLEKYTFDGVQGKVTTNKDRVQLRFIKEHEGVVSLDPLAYSENEVSDEELNNMLSNDNVFGPILDN